MPSTTYKAVPSRENGQGTHHDGNEEDDDIDSTLDSANPSPSSPVTTRARTELTLKQDDHQQKRSDLPTATTVALALTNPNEGTITITVDEAIERLGMGVFQLIVLTAAGLCFAADAMQILLLSFLSEV
jgi:hypothetical protein